MKSLKSDDDDETVDRLSELPDELIFEILSLLETRDLVKTSLFSKGWKDRWTTIPSISLYFINDSWENSLRTRNLINGVLQRWEGTKILRFKISLGRSYKYNDLSSLSKDVAPWVGFATEKKVEDLDLDFSFYGRSEVEAPECLFSCSSITKLRLSGFNFQINHNVGWDRLKTFELFDGSMNGDFLHHLVSSASLLQILDVRCVTFHGTLSIRSSTLKSLTLNLSLDTLNLSLHSWFRGDDPPTFTLWAPNLEQLTLWMDARTMHVLFDVPALTSVTLYMVPMYPARLIIEGALMQFFLAIKHVEALALRLPDYEDLGLMKGKCLFSNVKILKLIGGPIRPNYIVDVADFFPKVEKLIIDDWERFSNPYDFGETYPDSSLLQLPLKTVEVIWSRSNEIPFIFKLIEFLLECAINLQKIVIRKEGGCGTVHDSEELLRLQSSFPTLDVIFCAHNCHMI